MKSFALITLILIPYLVFCQGREESISKLARVMYLLETEYVDTVDYNHLAEEAIKKMISELDPHSKYLTKEALKSNNEAINGNFGGVGIHYQIIDDTLTVLSTQDFGPAETAGILPGDKILKINGINATGKTLKNTFFTENLRGEIGTKVKIEILRHDKAEPLDLEVTRGKIPIPTVDAYFLLDNNTGYIKLNGFSQTTITEFQNAGRELKIRGAKNLIIDLRGNPGGVMLSSVKLADEFLKANELIVYTEGEHYKRDEHISTSTGNFEAGRLVVLMDENSASASEIFAGAMQDLDRGIVMGRRSYGKGLVGRNFNLTDGTAIRLTTGYYYTPSGRCIQKPYSLGDAEYSKDLKMRYERGEYFNKDSIHLSDSLKYKTKSGRMVYGGGGIMPDIFVPADTTKRSTIYNDLINRGITNAFAGYYFDKNLKTLQSNYPDILAFNNFNPGIQEFESLKLFAKQKYLLEIDSNFTDPEKSLTLNQFKYLLGRNLYEEGAQFKLSWESDTTILKALEVINNKSEFKARNIQAD